jgi:translation initiation factor 2D
MSGSTLYSAHVLPNRPADAIPRDRREDVVIAKSSWKKVGKWFKAMSDGKGGAGLIKIKEDKNGGCMVLAINSNHDALQSHRNHRTVAQEAAAQGAAASSAADVASSGHAASASAGKELAIEEFWKPSGNGVSFWEACGVR